MERTFFNADDIHALRLELHERRQRMGEEEAKRDFQLRVERGRRAIREAGSLAYNTNKEETEQWAAKRNCL